MREQFPQILISVLIPVYNTRHYIEQCAESLMNQTMQEGVEFLFIDDASPDDSVEILLQTIDRFPQRKSQVRVLRNSFNMGITGVRQLAVKEARGEYVAWVDSDDWVEPNMLELLYRGTNNGQKDVVVQNHYIHDFNKESIEIDKKKISLLPALSPQIALQLFWENKHVPRCFWEQISRRSLIEVALNKLEPVRISEDTFAIMYLFLEAESACWIDAHSYHYRKVENSSSLIHSNYQTIEEWNAIKKNLDNIFSMLSLADNKRYRLTINYNKWFYKVLFRNVFTTAKSFWNEYHECHRDIPVFMNAPTLFSYLALWLTYNVYPIFRWRVGNNYKSLA